MEFVVQAPEQAPELLVHLLIEGAEGFIEQKDATLDRPL
jgi:hypothetical protein